MKYTAKGINASNMLVKLKQSMQIQSHYNKQNKIRLHINEHEGNALK